VGWSVYVLVSASSGATYVGISGDLERRLAQHNGLAPGGAKATRGGRPWTIGATFGPYAQRGEAQRVEHRVKRLRGRARLDYAGD
jgi:putative endonuclease